jgi:hypothetical protein
MDILILLGTMLVCFVIGMPIAYSLAMAAIAGALSIGIPLEALMLKISDGVSKVAMLTIPFFVLAGAIMAEGGMARRLVAFGDDIPERHFRISRGRYVRNRIGDDPADGEERLPPRVRNQSHHHRVGAGAIGPAQP